ncbi:MAG TPA: GNAT family N-acetyltransferase [Anaerolineae bacterium]|nr:GNAT family N-acetyltransferase [Anaerolineae bacterium]HNU05101.1 GNAT family N-acetyltransferase [Anaerolineae bacterium]
MTTSVAWITLPTASGLTLRVRPEQPGDGPALVDLFHHLSSSSRYLRFSKVMDDPDPRRVQQEAERLAQLGPPTDMAWLAFADLPDQPDAPVAGVRYIRTQPGEAELAVSVRDDMQRLGIGSALLQLACTHAQEEGLQRLTAAFRSENRGIWALLRRSPYPVTWELDGAEVHAVIDLTAQPAT